MDNLAIIGASYLQLPLIKKAKELGYITHVFAWASNDVGEKEADFFYPISIVEKDKILDECKKIGICGICSIASDLAMLTVNYVAQNMGLISNTLDCTYKSTNKYLMRKCFEANGDPIPFFCIVDENTNLNSLELKFPVIVKPTDRSGSRGINKIEKYEDLKNAIDYSIEESFEKKAIVEEFVEGDEYSVEYISFKGKHTFLALTKKFTTGAPHFIETGHLEPAPVSQEVVEKVKKIIEHSLDSLGVQYGASHSEIKIDEFNNIKIIEIGARMGGDCIGSHLVKLATGYDFVRMVIEIACGKEPDLRREKHYDNARVKFILKSDDLNDLEIEKKNGKHKYLEIVDFHPENVGKTTSSSNRGGCYILAD